jgi:serine/threonine protein kinase
MKMILVPSLKPSSGKVCGHAYMQAYGAKHLYYKFWVHTISLMKRSFCGPLIPYYGTRLSCISFISSNYLPVPVYVVFFLPASNILICRSDSCQCADIFCCECPVGSKCEIRISDFDSVKIFSRGLCATSVPDVPCKAKAAATKVLGTPYYRAPEVIELRLDCTRTRAYMYIHVHLHTQLIILCTLTHTHTYTHTHVHTHTHTHTYARMCMAYAFST